MTKKNFIIRNQSVLTPPKAPAPRQAPGAPQNKAHLFSPGNKAGKGRKPGVTLLTRVKEMLGETSRKEDGRYNTRFDDAADAFASKMEEGSFIHTKEYIDREEGKVPQRIADADGKNIKGYIAMPTEGPEAP